MFYNQTNNELYPTNSCGISAYLNAMVAAGYPQDVMEKTKRRYLQLEDEIAAFFRGNTGIMTDFKQWSATCDNPWEVHELLCRGFREYFKDIFPGVDTRDAFRFVAGTNIPSLESWLQNHNTIVVSSHMYPRDKNQGLDHIIAIVDFDETKGYRIIDSWGNPSDGYITKTVGDVWVGYQVMRHAIKPCDSLNKWTHYIKKYRR